VGATRTCSRIKAAFDCLEPPVDLWYTNRCFDPFIPVRVIVSSPRSSVFACANSWCSLLRDASTKCCTVPLMCRSAAVARHSSTLGVHQAPPAASTSTPPTPPGKLSVGVPPAALRTHNRLVSLEAGLEDARWRMRAGGCVLEDVCWRMCAGRAQQECAPGRFVRRIATGKHLEDWLVLFEGHEETLARQLEAYERREPLPRLVGELEWFRVGWCSVVKRKQCIQYIFVGRLGGDDDGQEDLRWHVRQLPHRKAK
jgi:hypothetical protein